MAEDSLLDDLDEALGDVHLQETPRLTKVRDHCCSIVMKV
jgi:hypothetical protein